MTHTHLLYFACLFLLFFPANLQADTSEPQQDSLLEARISHLQKGDYAKWKQNVFFSVKEQTRQKNYKLAITILDKAVNSSELIPDDILLSISRRKAFYLYQKIGDYLSARKVYEQSLYYCKKLGKVNASNAYFVLKPLANIYTRLGEYDKAVSLLEKAQRLCADKDKTAWQAKILNDLALSYKHKGNLRQSLNHARTGLGLRNLSPKTEALLFSTLASLLHDLGRYRAAVDTALLAFSALDNPRYQSVNHAQLAVSYIALGQNKLARKQYHEAIKQLEKVNDFSTARLQAKQHVALGKLDFSEAKYQAAIQNAQQVFHILFPTYTSQNLNENPPAAYFYAENTLMDAFILKGQVQAALQQSEQAIASYQAALKVMDMQMELYVYESSSLSIQDEFHRLYDLALEAVAQLEDEDKKARLAFGFMEQGKAAVLRQSIQQAQVLAFHLPEDLRMELRELKEGFLAAKQGFFEAQSDTHFSEEERSKLKEKSFVAKTLYDDFLARIKTEFSELNKQELYQTDFQLVDFQKKNLPSTQLMLEYFVGEEQLFVLKISRNQAQFYAFKKDFPLVEWVEQMRQGIYGYHAAPQALKGDSLYQKTANLFSENAWQLYKKLILPLGNLPEQLIIVPDGILGYIPFHALLSAPTTSAPTRFDKHAYLVRSKQISYSYSAMLLEVMKKGSKKKARKGMLAIGLSFEGGPEGVPLRDGRMALLADGTNLPQIPFVQEEISKICNIAVCKKLLDGEASVATFKEIAADYQVLHIATHGIINDEDPSFSFLAMAPISESNNYNPLYVNDLYSSQLNAEMVVLSACETGLGKLNRGEGVMSMARGFAYAGAHSIVTTLWSVSDEATVEVMQAFYMHLKSGLTKDAALRASALDYLTTHPSPLRQHPFYWAPYTPIGDMRPIDYFSPSYTRWYLLGASFLLIVVFLGWKRKGA